MGQWWQRVVLRQRPVPLELWAELCRRLPLLQGYEPAVRERLRELTSRFLARKDIQGAGGLEITVPMRVLIAAQACIPILNLGLQWYRGWVSVLVYPDEFLARHDFVDEAGVVHEGAHARIGESWSQGPVILSWAHAEEDAWAGDCGNVVIHEFAHKLDLLNGYANGLPPLHREMSRRAWTRAFTDAYEDFCERVESGEAVPFDEYAVEDPGEFFAVLSEAFFVMPRLVLKVYPEVYAQYRAFYRQDPAACPTSSTAPEA
jgi:Mlc titration factor MtfA (ptsG expression regulator)